MKKPVIDQDKCVGCGACVANCPTGALEMNDDNKATLKYQGKCDGKGGCENICPISAITMR
jgi:NAD-dependent dihydropyrimidine dehydrogenase PreA subunit